MSFREFVLEFTYPVRHPAPAVTLIVLCLLWLLANSAGWMGIWLIIVLAPAVLRYLMLLLEARARGVDPAPPGIEEFSFIGNAWSLFAAVHVFIAVSVVGLVENLLGRGASLVAGVLLAALLPAAFAVLAVTRSPLESLNPLTIGRVIGKLGRSYWAAPVAVLLVALLLSRIDGLPGWLAAFVDLYLLFALFAVIGGVVRPHDLFAEIDIETPAGPEPGKVVSELDRKRNGVLNHAYGFASRGNVDGALQHVTAWIRQDEAYPGDAWPWFLDAMLRWDDTYPALRLAQEYLDLLLAAGEHRAAAKLMLRCRHVNPEFRPHAASTDAALSAVREAGNPDLEAWLTRR